MLLDNAPQDNLKEFIADQFIQVVIFVLIIFLSSNLRIYLLHQNVYVLECELFVDHLQSTDHKVGKYLPSNWENVSSHVHCWEPFINLSKERIHSMASFFYFSFITCSKLWHFKSRPIKFKTFVNHCISFRVVIFKNRDTNSPRDLRLLVSYDHWPWSSGLAMLNLDIMGFFVYPWRWMLLCLHVV